jgi:hypothetical protein
MGMDRKLFRREDFHLNEKPGFICPQCQKGKLVIAKENVSIVDYDHFNNELQGSNEFEPEWLKFSFHGVFVCDNENCHEKIVFAGKSTLSCFYCDEDSGPDYTHFLNIEYIERAPYLIKITKKYPPEIRKILKESFQLFWIDVNSCANKIRISLEILMDLYKIKKYQKPGTKVPISLQQRINIFLKKFPELENILNSIKWIGNYASHNENITKDDLLDGYHLLEYALKKIYDSDEKEIIAIARAITKSKKPRSRKK